MCHNWTSMSYRQATVVGCSTAGRYRCLLFSFGGAHSTFQYWECWTLGVKLLIVYQLDWFLHISDVLSNRALPSSFEGHPTALAQSGIWDGIYGTPFGQQLFLIFQFYDIPRIESLETTVLEEGLAVLKPYFPFASR